MRNIDMYHRKISLTRQSAFAICLILFFIGASMVYFLVQRDIKQQLTDSRSNVVTESGDLRNRIEYQIHSTLSLMLGSQVYVASHPNITQQQFELIADKIIKRAPFVLNLGLAKDNVISHIYPLQGNEAALGLHYMDMPAQKAAVLRAIESKQAVLAGPVELRQGGQGLINRSPIFLDDAETNYWGISSVVIKLDEFYRRVGFSKYSNRLKFALRGKDGLGAKGSVFFGDSSMFNDVRNVHLSIPIPNGSWEMAASPLRGWEVDNTRVNTLYLAGFAICLSISGLIYLLLLANIELKKEKNNVVAAIEHKNRFFTYMTHELRTPLTSIYGVVRMLSGKNFDEQCLSANTLLANAERNCQRLMCLVNDILDLRKLELGHMEYKIMAVEVSDIVDAALDEVQQYARQYSIEIENRRSHDSQLEVQVDSKRMTQVLVNLLSNAIKFSPANDKVEVAVSSQGDSVCISVTDHGKGIENHKINSIFQEFVQADQAQSSHKIPTGTGLGLAISKRMVEDQGGSLTCFNGADGGAVFYFILPKYLRNIDNSQSEQLQAS